MIDDIVHKWNQSTCIVKRNEVSLFRHLGKLLMEARLGLYFEETHGNVAQVEYQSGIWPERRFRREISDLAIISHCQSRNETRLTFHQCKLEKRLSATRLNPDFRFVGDLGQYDLLHYRPKVKSLSRILIHENILNSANRSTIGTYGVFYINANDQVDYLYTGANYVVPKSLCDKTDIIVPFSNNGMYMNEGSCIIELMCVHGLKGFIHGLINLHIGAEVFPHSCQANFVAAAVSRVRASVSAENRLLDSISANLGDVGAIGDTSINRILIIDADGVQ